jgi:hypothetical protein
MGLDRSTVSTQNCARHQISSYRLQTSATLIRLIIEHVLIVAILSVSVYSLLSN